MDEALKMDFGEMCNHHGEMVYQGFRFIVYI